MPVVQPFSKSGVILARLGRVAVQYAETDGLDSFHPCVRRRESRTELRMPRTSAVGLCADMTRGPHQGIFVEMQSMFIAPQNIPFADQGRVLYNLVLELGSSVLKNVIKLDGAEARCLLGQLRPLPRWLVLFGFVMRMPSALA